MRRISIVALFLGAIVLAAAVYILHKPLLQIQWAISSRLPSQSLPFDKLRSFRLHKGAAADHQAQSSSYDLYMSVAMSGAIAQDKSH